MSDIRKIVVYQETVLSEGGRKAERPLKKVAVAAVIKNHFAGKYEEDLELLVKESDALGRMLAQQAVELLGGKAESYGKGGIVGVNGEQEHINACLTTVFGNQLRDAVGGGKAWITSATKRGSAGCQIDIPLAYKDALYVRSHYDSIQVSIPDAPLPDEIVVVAAMADGPRLNARLGGISKEQATKGDGLC